MIAEQEILKQIGDNGCYLLSMKRAAVIYGGDEINPVDLYLQITRQRHNGKPLMEKDCYINSPDIIMAILTGDLWSITHEKADYERRHGEIVIARYEWQSINKLYSHFVLVLEDGSIYDPLGNSNTVANGKVVSTRVFRRVV